MIIVKKVLAYNFRKLTNRWLYEHTDKGRGASSENQLTEITEIAGYTHEEPQEFCATDDRTPMAHGSAQLRTWHPVAHGGARPSGESHVHDYPCRVL